MSNLSELRHALRSQPATFLRDCMIAILDDVSTLSARVMAHRDLLVEMPKRHTDDVDGLRSQLAGLQRLVESLVNERGEIGQSLAHHSKMLVEHAAALDRHEEQLRDDYVYGTPTVQQLRAEVERLTREMDEAIRQSVAIVMQTAEAIAAWLERSAEAATIPTGNPARPFTPDSAARSAALVRAADGIRAGEWKP